MPIYPSIYRAMSVRIDPASLQAFVPQVFGDTPVTIVNFLVAKPSATGMGWVSFQAGNPDFPVWMGISVSGGGGGNGGGEFDWTEADERYINVLGDVMTGVLSLPPPEAPAQAVTKAYVDTAIEAVEGGGGPSSADPGDIKATIATTAPTGWLMLDGQSIINANALVPNLWAVAPAAWKVGSTLNLPNAADCTLMAGGTLGSIGGANSRTLVIANLPVHAHTIAHTHEHPHTHTIAHNHTASTSTDPEHNHVVPRRLGATGGGDGVAAAAGALVGGNTFTTNGANAHGHTVSVGGSSAGSSGQPSDATTGGASTGNSGNAGSGTALDTTPKHLRVNYIIKT
jgi:microcystin-dependent protein